MKLFLSCVDFLVFEEPVHLRTWNHHPAEVGYHFDFSGINLPITPSVMPSEQGGEFGGRKYDLFRKRNDRSNCFHATFLPVVVSDA
jgi:hypothetical protein